MLSNTATPIYYGQFREKVLRGEIPVCEEITLEMARIDKLISLPWVYYDPDPVEGWIEFCENELTLTDGSPLHLLDTFKLWGEQIYGWYYFIERSVYTPFRDRPGGQYVRKKIKQRLRRTQYLIVPRGAAKTMYDACVQAYELVCNPKTTEQCAVAYRMEQAEETLSPIRTAITKANGPVFKLLTYGSINNTTGSKAMRPKLASTKKGVQNFLTNSIISVRPMDIDALQSRRDACATVDEWLSCDIKENPINALEQGAAKGGIDDYIIVASSSEGNVRNGIGDTIKMTLTSILRGEYDNPYVSIWWYKMDDISEIGTPSLWLKAQPNLDRTVTYETYQIDVEKMEKDPASRNEILAKRFNIPCEGQSYYFTYEEIQPFTKREYWQMPCSMGADLSQGGDFCSFAFLFPLPGEKFGVKTINYITEYTYSKLPAALALKYDQFMKEGTLIIMPGTILDMMDVYDDLQRHIDDHGYEVLCFGYDPYNAREFVERWCSENTSWGVEKVIQGIKTESVPLTEIKKLAEDRRLIFDEELMSFTMGNCIVQLDTNGNKKLLKNRYEAKIDAVAATMDAFIAYKLHKESFD